MRILIFSPPFSGHYNVLFDLMERHTDHEYKLVFTTWTNMKIEGHQNLANSKLDEPSPALWTFPRVASILKECISIGEKFKPDLIIYDFFSIEGHFVGKKLGIPAWSSIGTFIGANDN
jgi:hypothetical protein